MVLQNHNHQDRKRLLWSCWCLYKKLLAITTLPLFKTKQNLLFIFWIINSKRMPRGRHSSHLQKIHTRPWHIPFKEILIRISLVFHNNLICNFQKCAGILCEGCFMIMKCWKSQCWNYLCERRSFCMIYLCNHEYPLSKGVS